MNQESLKEQSARLAAESRQLSEKLAREAPPGSTVTVYVVEHEHDQVRRA